MNLEAFSIRGATSAPLAPANFNEPPATPANLLPVWQALSAAVRTDTALAAGELNAACEAVHSLQCKILSLPAAGAADLTAKLRVWRSVIDDAACILDEQPELWQGLEHHIVAHIVTVEVSQ